MVFDGLLGLPKKTDTLKNPQKPSTNLVHHQKPSTTFLLKQKNTPEKKTKVKRNISYAMASHTQAAPGANRMPQKLRVLKQQSPT